MNRKMCDCRRCTITKFSKWIYDSTFLGDCTTIYDPEKLALLPQMAVLIHLVSITFLGKKVNVWKQKLFSMMNSIHFKRWKRKFNYFVGWNIYVEITKREKYWNNLWKKPSRSCYNLMDWGSVSLLLEFNCQ